MYWGPHMDAYTSFSSGRSSRATVIEFLGIDTWLLRRFIPEATRRVGSPGPGSGRGSRSIPRARWVPSTAASIDTIETASTVAASPEAATEAATTVPLTEEGCWYKVMERDSIGTVVSRSLLRVAFGDRAARRRSILWCASSVGPRRDRISQVYRYASLRSVRTGTGEPTNGNMDGIVPTPLVNESP
jgi:hypothetical protein